MQFASLKMPLLALAGVVASLSAAVPVSAADLVRGHYADPPRRAHVYRERRVVRTTTYVRYVEECQRLYIREPDVHKQVDVCFKPLSMRPYHMAPS